jgi:exopolyphosphatase/guanosine-5'-triphosphate,3'-diphosphate pyrophosphatase
MPRFATIDIGTNSVLLLVAERASDGRFHALDERAEITRLGRGVDATRRLSQEGVDATLAVLEAYARAAKSLGAEAIAVTATSAARDAQNGREFIDAVKARTGLTVEIIAGELEAQYSYLAVRQMRRDDVPLVVIDIGGGSTEFIYGEHDEVRFRHSFDVGSVRLTERYIRHDPPTAEEQATVRAFLEETLAPAPRPPPGAEVVGVAGTVTTLFAVQHRIDPYDAARVEGGRLSIDELREVRERLCSLPLESRRALPGLQPKRADVICAGAMILEAALTRLGASACTVSDRGVRWGLLASRFGAPAR